MDKWSDRRFLSVVALWWSVGAILLSVAFSLVSYAEGLVFMAVAAFGLILAYVVKP